LRGWQKGKLRFDEIDAACQLAILEARPCIFPCIFPRGVLEKTAINKLARAIGRATVVASSKSQVALEGYQGHGAFLWVTIEGVKGKAADNKGRITVNSLVSYIENTLPELTFKKWGYEQIPQKNLMGEDFQIRGR